MKKSFSPLQRTLLITCTVIYTAAYICRLNASAALGGIMGNLSLSMAQAGALQTVFAAVYAAGQLINGTIVDRVNPAKYMLTGILGSALCNLAMGLCSAYPALIAVWALNAAFQSMMWTPIMRLVALHFKDVRVRERANMTLALTLIVGHFLAWAISGFLCARVGWRYAFIAPGVVALLVFSVSAHVLTRSGLCRYERSAQGGAAALAGVRTVSVLASTGFFLVLATCLLYGFIRDGVVTWTPTILNQIGGGEAVTSTAFSLILPVINISGVVTGFTLCRRGVRPHGVAAALMALSVVCAPALMLTSGMLRTAVLLGLICAGMYGANTMLTALIPLEYNCVGKTGMTAGLIDSVIYAGSAFSGVVGGGIYETLGRNTLYGTWAAAGMASVVLLAAAGRMSARYWRAHRGQEE
ncbi:MAG: MFS transporter [Clostridia bacterium]|nr:MFS transporter [Clostridia bacterium]